ncbi:class I adenylate-forming enzyme family protein [Bradyrhizobium sp. U531]|uniref:class I adenylate-forming enzyme family protein n=1 Tax=Bradyrhizobium sp. U531 TaxID=3053458 RepID=UPI003F430911
MQNWSLRLQHIFADNAERAYLIDADTAQVMTYADLAYQSIRLLRQLNRRGLKPAGRVGVQLQNRSLFVTVYFACLLGGLTIVPLNNALPRKDRSFVLDKLRLSILLTDATRDASEIARSDLNGDALPRCALTHNVWGDAPAAEIALQDAEHELGRYLAAIDGDRIWSIHFTSGTTGLPKAVAHRVSVLLGNASSFNQTFAIGRHSRLVHVMPMAYIAGFLNTLLSAFTAEASIIVAPQFSSKSALSFWEPVKEHGGDTIWATPTMLAALTQIDRSKAGIELCRSRTVRMFSATAPLSTAVRRRFEAKYEINVIESYGLSELLLITANDGAAGQKNSSVGPCLPEVRIAIRNEEGKGQSAGRNGTIFVNTPFASAGYIDFNTGEPVAPTESWFNTGDLGHLDDEGYLFVTGRAKDLIIRGGFNISPRQIEEVLLQHPSVHDAAVVGMPHKFYGEQVVAAVIPRPGVSLEDIEASLQEVCLSALGPSTVPDRFVALDAFPATNVGKLRKEAIRQLLFGTPQRPPAQE